MKESETVELKKSTSELKEGIISIAAILNKHQKGELYFGVKNDGSVIGQDVTEQTLREVSKAVSDHIEPKIFPEIKKESMEGKDCIIMTFSGEHVPYFAYGRAYMRVADENRPLSAKELEKLILHKNKEKLRWDAEICHGAAISDIDQDKLKSFLTESGKGLDTLRNSLSKLNLLKANKLLNAAVILFGKDPSRFFSNAALRCAVFATDDTSVVVDMQDFKGDLFYLIGEAEKYFLKNIHIGMRLDGLKRVDVPEISKEAFREALVNAFCHRDYWNPDAVSLAIFRERVELRSPGLLYGDLTIEKIRSENVSERRNELIAALFHEVHLVERWGRGISKILSLERKVLFKEIGRHFMTIFPRKVKGSEKRSEKSSEKILALIRQESSISAKGLASVIGISQRAVEKHIGALKEKGLLKRVGPDNDGYWEVINVPDNVPDNVPETRLKMIIELISSDPNITIPSLAKELHVNEKTIKRDIEKLKVLGRIKRVGPDRGGHWEVL